MKVKTARALLLGYVVLAVAGCESRDGAREVPVSRSPTQSSSPDPATATKAPRAIATH
jgi:hypothetical protein